jgi:hypothetical protein
VVRGQESGVKVWVGLSFVSQPRNRIFVGMTLPKSRNQPQSGGHEVSPGRKPRVEAIPNDASRFSGGRIFVIRIPATNAVPPAHSKTANELGHAAPDNQPAILGKQRRRFYSHPSGRIHVKARSECSRRRRRQRRCRTRQSRRRDQRIDKRTARSS